MKGWLNAVVFVVTVFAVHRGLAAWCAHSTWVRHLVRGKPSVLVRDGRVVEKALNREGVSRDELQAGLRKLGYDSPESVKLAVLEETGHISAVGADGAKPSITPERLNPCGGAAVSAGARCCAKKSSIAAVASGPRASAYEPALSPPDHACPAPRITQCSITLTPLDAEYRVRRYA